MADTNPQFYKARSVPFALREKIETELDHLVAEGVIAPVESCKWAAPIVPVMKQDGQVRICGDSELTAYPATDLPLPKIKELFDAFAGGEISLNWTCRMHICSCL